MQLPSALRRVVLATAAGIGVTCMAAGLTQPALADPAAPVAVPVSARTPTPQEVEEARRAAEASTAEAQAARTRTTKAQEELDAVAAQASAALERYGQAVEAKRLAEEQERYERERLAEAERQLAESKKQLGRWASEAYKDGGSLEEYSALVTVLESRDTNEVPSLLASVNRVGANRDNAVSTYRAAKLTQEEATARAKVHAETARVESEKAEAAKKDAEALVEKQKGKLAEMLALQAAAEGDATTKATQAANLAAARLQAEAAAAAALAAGARSVSGGLVGEIGACAGGDVTGYANGTIPRSALCPLFGSPRHVLRADAAHAFNQLSQAYAAHFGRAMCVTDSYRPLADQISVAARKPGLAARPGTSRHGLGIAVDLCDGVNVYGTPTFNWLKQNSAVYGWIHPSWADKGGSGPFEPWHWEYVG
ncbi:D-alanyl-D-alanine carboxypeptidase-like protein [Kineococcus xinjiangensis]|uniref:D-alanyl-D-alanine carboxypeptidase-like protein n=1 Tax=Kineococcus xinjiangensis TaxID=512762 RepID=A0A2S6IKK7_9ACTN|nr:M15 family metallopeptidase [Kineococcus xinjiangensis]PPK94715.1 D-alanyl-D-alanine carboxypeptidase-like protein [Kineococcus xinjiangensis]